MTTGCSFRWFLCPLDKPPSIFEVSTLYGTTRYSRLILYSASEFLQGALVPFIEEWHLETKIWTLCAHCYWVVVTASRPSEQRGVGNIPIFLTLVLTHRCVFQYLYVHILESILPQSQHHKVHSSLTTSSVTLLQQRETWQGQGSNHTIPAEGRREEGACCIVLGLKDGILIYGIVIPSREQHE